MRFYNSDGLEEEVQDPTFFMDDELLLAQMEAIAEMLTTYVD